MMSHSQLQTMLVYVIASLTHFVASTVSLASPVFLVSENQTLRRFQTPANVDTFDLGITISGMTTIPAGMSVGNLNGGANGGDVIIVGSGDVFRLDGARSPTPTLTKINANVPGPINASPLIVGNRMFGIGGALPDGAYIVEWNPTTFAEINRWTTGVFGGPGGLVHVSGNTFRYTEPNTDTLWEYTLGNNTSTPVGSVPSHDYSGLERDASGTIYASFALPTTGQMVFGTLRDNDAMFTQLGVLGPYILGGDNGITGITIVPESDAISLMAAIPLAMCLAVGRKNWPKDTPKSKEQHNCIGRQRVASVS